MTDVTRSPEARVDKVREPPAQNWVIRFLEQRGRGSSWSHESGAPATLLDRRTLAARGV